MLDETKIKPSVIEKKKASKFDVPHARSRSILPKFDHISDSRGLVSKDFEGFG